MLCKNCNSSFPLKIKINGKLRNLCKRKYCIDCSPFGSHNTKQIDKTLIVIPSCKKHGQVKHYKRSGRDTGYTCGKCSSEKVQRRREKIKQMAVEYKGGKCNRCSYNKCMAALTFHHLDPKQKEFGIADKGHTRSWDRVKAELDKCILLCHNCHAEEHALKEHLA